MKTLNWIGSGLAAIGVALGIGPLGAEMLRNWMSANGYLEHPEAGVAWLVTLLASITRFWWFYWLVGLAVAAVIIWILGIAIPAYLVRRNTRRLLLAQNMLDLAAGIKQRQGGHKQWPDNISDIRGYVESCIIEAKKVGLYPPPEEVFKRGDGVIHLHKYRTASQFSYRKIIGKKPRNRLARFATISKNDIQVLRAVPALGG